MRSANDNVIASPAERHAAHNAALRQAAIERRQARRAAGLLRHASHNHAQVVAKHQRIYGGFQLPMFG